MSATTAVPAPAATQTPPPAAGWPRPIRWTVPLFHAVNASGALAGRRPMLIRGVLLEQGPMNPPHALALELVVDRLRAAFGAGWRFRNQSPLVLGRETDPMPDLVVLEGDARAAPIVHPTTAALVIEVSDTTLAYDMTDKAELYATAGIPEYWVLDLNARQLHVYRDPAKLHADLEASAYGTHLTLDAADSVSPLAALNATLSVADLLP